MLQGCHAKLQTMTDLSPVRRTHTIRSARPDAVFEVVADFPAYARLFKDISESRVLQTDGNQVRAEFCMALVLPIRYVLDLVCDRANLTIDWTLVKGDVMTTNQGGWAFHAAGDDTVVDYHITLSLKAPVPGFILRKVTDGLINLSLPAMFKSIEDEVRTRARAQAQG